MLLKRKLEERQIGQLISIAKKYDPYAQRGCDPPLGNMMTGRLIAMLDNQCFSL